MIDILETVRWYTWWSRINKHLRTYGNDTFKYRMMTRGW